LYPIRDLPIVPGFPPFDFDPNRMPTSRTPGMPSDYHDPRPRREKDLEECLRLEKMLLIERLNETGTVISVIDGIAKVKGLFSVGFGELVEFSNLRSDVGMVLSIESNFVQVVLFGSDKNILPGQIVSRKYSSLEVYVSFKHLGRIVNSLGEFIDGKSTNKVDTNIEPARLKKSDLVQDTTKLYSN